MSFVADRGLGSKKIFIPGHFRILQGSTVVADHLASDEPISLGAGLDYTVEATATEDWDLANRLYVKRQIVNVNGREDGRRFEIKVHERRRGEE